MYPSDRVNEVLALASEGRNRCEISRATGIPRTTVRSWLAGRVPQRHLIDRRELITLDNEAAYAYLLGLYLGDGYVVEMKRGVFRLCITLDDQYPSIIQAAAKAMEAVLPMNRVGFVPREGSTAVQCHSKAWPVLLPQHGPGKKHQRRIELADWQHEITTRQPQALLRGLIHSDGSRFVARQRSRGRMYAYPRYCFTNMSEDILGIFTEHLDLVGVRWTRSNAKNIQIARRESVETLDSFIGPKR